MASQIVTDNKQFTELVEKARTEQVLTVVDFWASWAEPCKHMNDVFQQLAKSYPKHNFLQVEAEEVDDVAEKFDVASVPTFVFIKDGKEIDRLTGADALLLARKVETHAAEKAPSTSAPAPSGKEKNLTSRYEIEKTDKLCSSDVVHERNP